jgi:hypothetical protein
MWKKLADKFFLCKKDRRGVIYVIPYGKSKIVQFLALFNLWRFVWMSLTFRSYIATELYNYNWISEPVFKKMQGKKIIKRKMFLFEVDS